MALDIIGYINDNVTNLTTEQKLAMMDDICYAFDYREEVSDEDGNMIPNPITKKEWANRHIIIKIVGIVNLARMKKARDAIAFEELELE